MASRAVERVRGSDGELPAFAWPGGYPLLYYTADGGTLCPSCANCEEATDATPDDPDWYVIAYDVHWEGDPAICDHCGLSVESAYGSSETPD